MAIDYRESPYNIDTNKKIDAAGMRAALDTKQEVLPVGTILMHDGTDWEDNVTLTGWYACTLANADKGCPNLANSFIKGADSISAVKPGGNNSHQVTIGSSNLPTHTHSIVGNTGQKAADTSGNMNTHDSGYFNMITYDGAETDGSTFTHVSDNSPGAIWDVSHGDRSRWWGRVSMNIQHKHSLPAHDHTLPASTGNNSTTAAKLNIEPQSYALIYIRKCV